MVVQGNGTLEFFCKPCLWPTIRFIACDSLWPIVSIFEGEGINSAKNDFHSREWTYVHNNEASTPIGINQKSFAAINDRKIDCPVFCSRAPKGSINQLHSRLKATFLSDFVFGDLRLDWCFLG